MPAIELKNLYLNLNQSFKFKNLILNLKIFIHKLQTSQLLNLKISAFLEGKKFCGYLFYYSHKNMDNLKVIHNIDQALGRLKRIIFTYNLIIFMVFLNH